MDKKWKCPRCGNDDPRYIGNKFGQPYCRLCIAYQGEEAPQHQISPSCLLKLDYCLSPQQKKLSEEILQAVQRGQQVMVHAVTGAGKTELVFASIKAMLETGRPVGFTIPRRDVVIELANRLQKAFPKNRVQAVYGGHTEKLSGDIVVLTTHQLYRYPDYFQLLVFDEIDAFPYKGNPLLPRFLDKSCRGTIIYLSATLTERDKNNFRQDGGVVLELFQRFHNHPLPVPQVVIRFSIIKFFTLLFQMHKILKMRMPLLIFTPTIALSHTLFLLTKVFFTKGEYVNSKRLKRTDLIEQFRQGKIHYLFTTSILERGVTVSGLKVIVYAADHPIFDRASLVQIAGRSGRKIDEPVGKVIFISETSSQAMKEALDDIKNKNTHV